MKKIMMAAAIVCAAACAQAAQVLWANTSTSKIVGLNGSTAISQSLANTYAFSIDLVKVGTSGDTVVQTLSGTTAMGMTAGVLQGAAWTYTYDTNATNGDVFKLIAKMTVDGKAYEMTINPSPNAIAATDNTGKDTFSWAAGNYGGTGATGDVGKWVAVAPEPTSGLLLLLGMAGLALRRRRA